MNAHMSKPLFYILSFTWGLPMNLIGIAVAVYLLLTGHHAKRWNYCFYFEVGEGWGGTELGVFFLVNKNPSAHIKDHEHGHGIQNCYFGPLMLPIISIPSFLRYWYRELRYHRRGKNPPVAYDSIWFEGSATRLGRELSNWLHGENNC